MSGRCVALALAVLVGCRGSEVDDEPEAKGRRITALPTSLEASCAPTENALRFDCHVTVDPPQPVQIRFSRTDGEGVPRIHTSELEAADHTVPLYLMAPEREYSFVASVVASPDAIIASGTITTGAVPSDLASVLEVDGRSTVGHVGAESPCADGAMAVIYDTGTGDLVWFEDIDPDGVLGHLHMVRFTEEHTILGETNGRVVEIDLAGNDLTRFDVSFPPCCGPHHDIFRRDDRYYLIYREQAGPLILDTVAIFDLVGNELKRWLASDHLDIPPGATGDWLHTNAVYVDAQGDLWLSFLAHASVAKFEGDLASPDFGQRLWVMEGDGPTPLGTDIPIDWSAVDGADAFGSQHNLHLRHDGRVMLLDNDHLRGLVLTVDEANSSATADAVYAVDEEQTCGAQGTAADALNGNAFVACDKGALREYDLATGSQLWQAEVECDNGGAGDRFGVSASRWYPLDGW